MILFGKEFRLHSHTCAACAAKDQTITLLADVVDWHRAQPASAPAITPSQPSHPPHLQVIDGLEKLWATDEQEDIEAALEQGAITTEAAERALAAVQARNTTIEIVS